MIEVKDVIQTLHHDLVGPCSLSSMDVRVPMKYYGVLSLHERLTQILLYICIYIVSTIPH